MNLQNMSFFKLASDRLDWLTARQKVLSQNIANADTPGQRAQDVAPFEEYLRQVRGAGPGGSGENPPTVTRFRDSWVQSPDGNNIALEQQTILASSTASQHRLASTLYRKGHEMLMLAVSSR